ncbi:MAG: FprA family A-type flavoprotein [Chloroflexi bacterium]|nr:FprA family A-type flavoprotein [Chloroflexota bacterium]
MARIEITPGVYWVGAVDWHVRDIHGLTVRHGATYNAFLILDDRATLIDTVKAPFADEMMARIREIVDPKQISYVVSNHVELDHSGSLPRILQEAPNAKVITVERHGETGLARSFHANWPLIPVKEGDSLEIGRRRLSFYPTPMLHWPDSLMTYSEADGVLFCMDIFGQHLATSQRFDDEVDLDVALYEASVYYANIMWPYPTQTLKAVDRIKALNPRVLATSHGVLWRGHKEKIIDAWTRWGKGETRPRVVIVFDTMYGSTETMARAISEAVAAEGAEARLFCLSKTHRSDVANEALEARAILVGSPTMHNTLYPTVADFLAYLKGLRPRGRLGAAFGSYGWGGGATKAVREELRLAGMDVREATLDVKYVPDTADLEKCRQLGLEIARRVKSGTVEGSSTSGS